MPALVLTLFLALDLGLAFAGRQQLQTVADSSARAALLESTSSGRAGASALAAQVARQSTVTNGGVVLEPSDIEFGTYSFQEMRFTVDPSPIGPPSQSVRVRSRRTESSPTGSFLGFSGPIEVAVEAVASYRCRDVVLVQDVSGSFADELDVARLALLQVAQSLALSSPGSTQVGLVSFASSSETLLELSPVPAESARLETEIQSLSLLGLGAGTNQAAGLDDAIDMLERSDAACAADRLIIIVSDGAPNLTGTVAGAIAQANRAESLGISIAPVLLDSAGIGELAGPVQFNASLARGFGVPLVAEQANELPDTVLRVLAGFPVVLVR